MKTTAIAVFFAALLFASQAPLAHADDVDELLSGTLVSASTAPEVASSASAVESAPVAVEGATSSKDGKFTDPQPWRAVADAPGGSDGASIPSAAIADQRPADSTDLTMVPEPSAVVLAVVALFYFLIFGRRRTLA
jgi:hypothetical protein